MGAFDHTDSLSAALDALRPLGSPADRDAIAGLRERLASHRLRVLVAGEAKRGKSTLVNAMLGRSILPTGVLPVTALATTVQHGDPAAVKATFTDGRTETFPLSALDDLVTEHGNPGNRRRLRSVAVLVDAPVLARGVELVDTPGTGSVHGHNTIEAEAALATMDAAVFVLSADPPISASERDLITHVAERAVEMFVVLNKVDRLGRLEQADVLAFTAGFVNDAAGRVVRIYPLSAQDATMTGGDRGFTEFADDFAHYLDDAGTADLQRSVQGQALRIASALRDELLVARRAAEMRGSDAEERVREFAARLAAVQDRRGDAAGIALAMSKRLLESLNRSAEQAGSDRTRQVERCLSEFFDDALRTSTAAEIERTGRARLAELAVAEAEDWRMAQTAMVEAELAALDERLTAGLHAELEAVRHAAASLLGLDLAVAEPAQHLEASRRFFYEIAEQAGQTELLAGTIRRHMPGDAGRNRARAHLRREAGTFVARQIGRARADLQYRLAEATRRLADAIDARYAAGTGRLEKALSEADALRNATAEEVAAHQLELGLRLTSIDRVHALLADVRGDRTCELGIQQ